MQSNLTNEILGHIFTNLGLMAPRKTSLKNDYFLLSETIDLEENDKDKCLPIWGAQVPVAEGKFNLLLTEMKDHPGEQEYFLVSKMEDCPIYGCYILLESTVVDKNVPKHGEILFSLKDNAWLPTDTFLQATFLAGMEQLKELITPWQPTTDLYLMSSLKTFTDHIFSSEEE